jgi:pullulanase
MVEKMSWLLWPKKTFSFYSPKAESVFLVVEGLDISWSMKQDAHGYWSINSSLLLPEYNNLSYHFQVIENGHAKRVADPTARRLGIVEGQYKSYFCDLQYQFQNQHFQKSPFNKLIIYETHLPALTRHASMSLSSEDKRGTYLGVTTEQVLDHLEKLNVAVEFLPLHFSDEKLGGDWGYYSVNYHAMRNDLALEANHVNEEVMQLVDTLHGRNIPVILDVVFNHGAELWVKAWGKEVVYRKLDNGEFCQGSGCGDTVQTEHPHIRKMIIDSLLHLVNQYHFDGFRFDLGALHDTETMLEIDRRLPNRIYLIAEPWALSGSQWGKPEMSQILAKTRWSIWNDDFRESGRTFIKGEGDYHNRDLLMRGIVGSHIEDGGWAIRPQQSINYLSCHDGLTLADLVGHDKQRVFLGIFLVLTSQGIPMLGEGSELLYSKQGYDNSYNRADLNQLDWSSVEQHQDLISAVTRLIAIRKKLSHFNYNGHLKVNDHKSSDWNIDWIHPTGYPHQDNVNAIGYVLRSPHRFNFWHSEPNSIIILLNGSHSGVDFQLPKGAWEVVIDANQLDRDQDLTLTAKNHYHLHSASCALLFPV